MAGHHGSLIKAAVTCAAAQHPPRVSAASAPTTPKRKRPTVEVECVDLSRDETASDAVTPGTNWKRQRPVETRSPATLTREQSSTRQLDYQARTLTFPSQRLARDDGNDSNGDNEADEADVSEGAAASAPARLPTPDPSPPKPKELHELPELADRYMPKYSLEEDVEVINPRKFCLKPPCWKRWAPKHYVDFAAHLRQHFDPVPFAREAGLPLEEVRNVFSILVVNPLYSAKEARQRGEEGFMELVELHRKFGTPMRTWTGKTNGKRVVAELAGVKGEGVVVLTMRDGSKKGVKVENLSEVDVKYLEQTLTEGDRGMLWKQGEDGAGEKN